MVGLVKHVSVLGSTGSIGSQTLDIASNYPDKFKIVGLASYSEVDSLLAQAKKFKPEAVCVFKEEAAKELEKKLRASGDSTPVFSGMEGLKMIATMPECDTVVVSVVGSVGLVPTIEAAKAGKNLAVANKETLVVAGEIVMREVRKHNVHFMPIDSEHVAIFQCLNGENRAEINKIILTASGGPFRKAESITELEQVTVEQALGHPTWKMGPKITIDSSTLMNKGLEVIEAHWLFNMPYERIDIVVHPQSIIHSMVEFADGGIVAQLGIHDMRIPILYSLSYPERLPNPLPKLNLLEVASLTFEKPKYDVFPCLSLALEAGKTGGTAPAVLNAANEIAVNAFLNKKIKYMDIPKIVEAALNAHPTIHNPSLEQILEADSWARKEAEKAVAQSR
jgi:1-deoxy-D-xylulose-5-phosphate reductoisomerase